jgi:hypothetical protein
MSAITHPSIPYAHHLPISQINITRQSISRIKCDHSPINQCQERRAPKLVKSVKSVKPLTAETSETAEVAEVVFGSTFP